MEAEAVTGFAIPPDVVEHVRSVFRACNAEITTKLSNIPNAPEESFDLTWIEHMGRYAAPVTLPSEWVVRIDTHYLGGMRHFYRWEIADIGLLVHVRLGAANRRSKVALLQSKRLYPDGTPIREEARVDYEVGFGRLADPEDDAISMAFAADFNFVESSRYEQIKVGSTQVAAIDRFETDVALKVYYQLYNPWSVPFSQRIPLAAYTEHQDDPDLGVRVVPSRILHALLKDAGLDSPRLMDLTELGALPSAGWRLEQFVCDELLACREGDQFVSISEDRIDRLFNRRSGPIAAGIAIRIEAPDASAAAA